MENVQKRTPDVELIISETTPPGEYVSKDYIVGLLKYYLIKMEGLDNLIKDGKEVYAHSKAQGIKDHLMSQLRCLEPHAINILKTDEEDKNS